MSHREVRELAAELDPRPDVAATIRKLPERPAPARGTVVSSTSQKAVDQAPRLVAPQLVAPQLGAPRVESHSLKLASGTATSARPAVVEPTAPGRYQVRFTAGVDLREKLERLQALMRSSVPDGDLARIIEIAVTEKLERLEAKRFGRTHTPRSDLATTDTSSSSRHIPAAVRRFVCERDGSRCTYRDTYGRRCDKRHNLEFHHKRPFGLGGDHSPENVTLMCRAHNTLLAEQDYGEDVMSRFRAATSRAAVPVDAYGARIVVQPRRLASG
jgi:hypothetical protein